MDSIKLLYVTCKNREEAVAIGRALVESRLAACVNILPGMHSLYRWKNKIESSEETVLIVKTRHALTDVVTRRIKELHSYEIPCILNIPVEGGSDAYLQWILRETESK